MTRPRLLDLFCGAGGAAVGYHRAGFDIVGVDNQPQPNYPFDLHRCDAIEYLAEHGTEFDAIHASPPCQDWTVQQQHKRDHRSDHLLFVTRAVLKEAGQPWVIENVPGAAMRTDYKLCGCMFGLPRLRRERWFETSWQGFDLRQPCSHPERSVTVAGHPGGTSTRDGAGTFGSTADWKRSMGIDWMTARELAQAVPPAYTEHIGHQLAAHIKAAVA